MSAYVRTDAIKQAVEGRETEILERLGIPWREGRPHIRCPYPAHGGESDWRWDKEKRRAFCTCHTDNIFGVVSHCEGLDFEGSKMRVAELLGSPDLIKQKGPKGPFITQTAEGLLASSLAQRDETLVSTYLGHRLGVAPEAVFLPSTRALGLKSLGYFDPPPTKRHKPVHVGDYPCLVFETKNPTGDVHAHRIYVASGGAGKADLGIGSDSKARDPKKSARKADDRNISGHAVFWGDPSVAPWLIVAEGIETAQAVAQTFADEIRQNGIAVAAGISANGVAAFTPWPANTRITVAADRDEAPATDKPGSRAGEVAARKMAHRLHKSHEVAIALPGCKGEKRDWLDVFTAEGAEAVRAGILAADQFEANRTEMDEAVAEQEKELRRKELRRHYPLPYGPLGLFYDLDEKGRPWVFRKRIDKKTGEATVHAICSPVGVIARLRYAGLQETFGLRVAVQDMCGKRQFIDLERGSLARSYSVDAREHLLAAGLRVHGSGENVIVDMLKSADPADEILVLRQAGWHILPGLADLLFACPDGRIIGGTGGQLIELASEACLPSDNAISGHLDGWKAAIAAAMATPGCPHWTLGILAGFVGPLIGLIGADSCGINFSGLSSSGKTTAQRLAASLWGRPIASPDGLFQSALTTVNSLEAVAARATSTVLVLDELAHVNGRDLGSMIYKLAGGVGKQRMTSDARLQASHRWATFVVFSAESSLEEKIRADDQKWTAGMAVRFIDIDVTGSNRAVTSDTLRAINEVKQNFGHAGNAFVQGLMAAGHHRDPDALRARIDAEARRLAGPHADSARIRAASTFALLRVAGDIAQEVGVLPSADILAVIDEAWRRFLDSSDAQALDPATQAIDNIHAWIAERWDSSIHHVRTDRKFRDSQGWYDHECVYLPPNRLVEAAGGALKEHEIAKALKDAGYIVKMKDDKRLTYGYVPGVGRVKTYALSRQQFGQSDAVEEALPHEPLHVADVG